MPDATAAIARRLARTLGAQVIETHISWVLLAPELAYKLKKPVRLPFVDYSTLAQRKHFCEEEVRLNRRLAPSLYLGVSRVSGTPRQPALDGAGDTLDYAVRMRRFPDGALFSEQLEAGTLDAQAIDRFALQLGRFHAAAPRTTAAPGGEPGLLPRRALAALDGARPVLGEEAFAALRAWIPAEWDRVAPLYASRLAAGFVREGHGDLHLANIVRLGEDIAAFDCIEFDAALRWIDVLDDAAFAFMDLVARGRADLGWRFLNGWLEHTGDYQGLPLLRFYTLARALVRAQVEHLRAPGCPAARRYAHSALAWSQPPAPRLYFTHGLPGSGKTFVSQRLLEREGAIRIRSDVERKRLHGLQALDDSRARGVALYTPDVTARTYLRLLQLAEGALRAGFPVVLDAAFLRHDERQAARDLAARLGLPCAIVACEAPLAVLKERLQARRGDASEADVAVLERLRTAAEPLRADELAGAYPQP